MKAMSESEPVCDTSFEKLMLGILGVAASETGEKLKKRLGNIAGGHEHVSPAF